MTLRFWKAISALGISCLIQVFAWVPSVREIVITGMAVCWGGNHTRKSNNVIYGEGLGVMWHLSTSKMTGN